MHGLPKIRLKAYMNREIKSDHTNETNNTPSMQAIQLNDE